jgi:hypothetical protein
MNTEYVWWAVVLLLVGAGAIAFLALGTVPEIPDAPDPADEGDDDAHGTQPGDDQSLPVSTTVPGSDDPGTTSDTP